MLTTSHALTAGILLKTIPDPRIALPLIFVSHFVLDLVPHWDVVTDQDNGPQTLTGKKNHLQLTALATMDILLGLGVTFWLFQDLNPLLLLVAIGVSQLPDWIEMPYFFWGIKLAPSIAVKKIQHRLHSRLSLPWGLLTQIAIILPLLWWTLVS